MHAVLLAWLALSTAAGEQAARPHLDAGTRRARRGDLEGALRSFRKGLAEWPSAEAHCFVGLTYLRLGRLGQAYVHQRRAEGAGGAIPAWCQDELRGALGKALAAARHQPVTLELEPAGARARPVQPVAWEDDEAVAAPELLWLSTGTHLIEVSAPGLAARRIEIAVWRDPVKLAVSLVPEPPPPPRQPEPPPAPPTAPSPAVAPPSPGAPPPPSPAAAPRSRAPLWIGAAGVGALALGGVFHGLAARSASDAESRGDRPAFDRDLDSFRTRRTAALVAYGAGALAVGAAAYLWLRDGATPREPRAAVLLLEGGAAATLELPLP